MALRVGSRAQGLAAGPHKKSLRLPRAVADDLSTVPGFSSLALVFMCGAVAAMGGIGGGGILVPLYILVERLSAHEAIPMSKVRVARPPRQDRQAVFFVLLC